MLFADTDENPHILRFGFEPVDVQGQKLSITDDLYHTCVYPREAHLREVVDPAAYDGKPYTFELAVGGPQLSYRSFDLSVLEAYRNDPRYMYQNNDIKGSISVRDEHFESEHMLERDQVLLQTYAGLPMTWIPSAP